MRRGAVAAALLAAAVLALRWAAGPPLCRLWDAACLPAELALEEQVADLLAAPALADRRGLLAPGDALGGGGRRRALLAPAPAEIALRAPAGPDTELRLAMGVEGARRREEGRSAVRFVVRVDGREALRRELNPAATRHDRRWVEARVPLPADRAEVEVALATEAVAPGKPVAGTAGWSALRVVRIARRPRQPARPGAPNLLVLLIDTLRADAVGGEGTPAFSTLAARGLVFDQAVAAASWTLPSVASLLTGLPSWSHGAVGRHADAAAGSGGDWLADALRTWPEIAADAGITTIGVSSNPLVSRATNLAQGFETFVELPWDPERRSWASADAVNAAFLSWLRRNRGHRFAAWLHYMDVHDPYAPPPALAPPAPPGLRPVIARGRVNDVARDVNFGRTPPLAPAEVARLRALYDAEVRAWDGELAWLLAALEDLGVLENTIVLLTADHGEGFQEHGRLAHATHLYDEVLQVPLVIAGPGVRPGRVDVQVSGVDVMPTALAALGLPISGGLPGASLLAPRATADAFAETWYAVGPDATLARLVAVRRAGWKLIEAPATGAVEVYDLARDAAERRNLAGGAPEEPALRAALARELASAPAPPAADGGDPDIDRKLRALGYVP